MYFQTVVMSNRNQFIAQLSGTEFNGLTKEQAAEILHQWKLVSREKMTQNHLVGAFGKLPEKMNLEIPKKILYLESWGKLTYYMKNIILIHVLETKVMMMGHFSVRALENVVVNATHIQLDPILDYARTIARIAGPGTSIYRDILKAINLICYTPWEEAKAADAYFGLVDQLPYVDRELTREVRRMLGFFMRTVNEEGLMDYNMSPPMTFQDELPGELLTTMLFNASNLEKMDLDKMENINIELSTSTAELR